MQKIALAQARRSKFAFLIMLLCIFGPASTLTAQEFTGRVTDSSGAVVSKAQITAHNLDTNVDTKTTTTDSGNYTIPYLIPGNYSVSAEAKGFDTGLHTGIVLQVGQTSTVNFALKVGTASETVTVNADTLLDFGKADNGEVVENTRVTELPLNGRDPGMLAILNAGAIWTGSPQYQRPFDDTQANLSVNGGGAGNTALMLDGVSNTASTINNTGQAKISYVPPVDSVQEFKIITNPYDAQYGLLAGGVEDVTLKSGTNQLHGDVYEYARRTWLDANTWQDKWDIANATPGTDITPYATPEMKWDQYGAELDGPVRIPKLYNGRDKSFFTMQYENFNEIEPNVITEAVPSPQWINGDFSNLVYWTGSAYAPIEIKDPESIVQQPDGSWVRQQFGPNDPVNPNTPANVIPANRINPMAQAIMKLYPAPNTATANGSNPFASNYTAPGNDTDHYRNVLGKWDQNWSSKDRFSIHYGYWERIEHRSYDGFTGPEQEGQLPHGERSNTFTLQETHTFSPNLLFDFRANVSVRADYSYNGPPFDPTQLGWTAAQTAAMGPAAASEFPYLDISEFASMGTNSNGQTISNSLSLFPSATWIKNKHTLHFGLDGRFMQSVNDVVGGGNNFWIDRTWTQTNCGDCGSWDQASGNSIASFLLGNPTSGSDAINVKTFWSGHYWAPFVQDDWKITPKLTLNLGVRWDIMPAETERHNQGDYAFSTTAVNPINSSVSVPGYSQILGGVTFLGANGNPRGTYKTGWHNIQPRVGFAWAWDDRTVFRGGFGESFRTPENAPNTLGFSSTTNYQSDDPSRPATTYPNLANQIDNPYSAVIQPTGSTLGLLEDLGQGPWYLNPTYQLPSFWNYSVGLEHQFFRNDVLNIQYVGSRLYNGDSSDNVNRENYQAMIPCNPQFGGRIETCSNNNLTNPFVGISAFNGSSYYNDATLNALNFTRPFPEFGDITEYQTNYYRTWYNSLQVTAMHKWSNSLTVHGTWTWSKLMDAGGWADSTYRIPYRSIDANDYTHRVTLSGVYLLPVGRGRSFLPNANRVVDGVIGGWELGSLYIYQTGAPWILPTNPNEVYLHSAYVKPHIQTDNGYIRLAAACAQQYTEVNGTYVLKNLAYDYDGSCPNGADFQQVPTYGETPQNVYTGIRIPRYHQFDANLSKNFALWENFHLQVRLEAFNVLNHPLWSESPDGSTNDTSFGEITRGPSGQSNLPRQMQVSAKITW
ncbi:TonB-dependent receptor domain-containing protein [Acidicapsa dinghuensis]|uniref:TonB-dependent receptor domain-containing protein n=1 Tax=Acidicapsa dinghuensis TaxID=2218256 RepID=A0ABW1EJ62_9BACT|nr:TonB-dependent receptor [Acidicapsa dinghuensis]